MSAGKRNDDFSVRNLEDLSQIISNLKNIKEMDLSKDNIASIGTLFKKRFTNLSKSVITNRVWLKSTKSSNCDVLMTFTSKIKYQTIHLLLGKILDAGLIVNVKYHGTTRAVAFYITASYEKLLKGAEDLELRKLIKANFGGGVKEFIFEEQEFYQEIENEETFLSSQERQQIIYDILNKLTVGTDTDEDLILEGRKVPNGRKLIYWCQKHKIISQIIPIHDQKDLTELRTKWVFAFAKHQPMEKIRKYFGIKLALYFAWLGFYTKALIVPAFLGLAMWLSMGSDEFMDSIYFLIICGFNLIWSICFNALWKQKGAEYSYKWGTLDIKQDLLQDPRPMYKGVYKPSKVTNKLEPHYPDYKRVLFRYLVTLPFLCATIVFTVVIMVLMFQLQDFFSYATENKMLPELLGFTNFLPKMVYANIISGLNTFYKKLCTWLNDRENYREQSTHENHLIIKIVSFQFINSYLSLFYISFYLRDVQLLQAQLFAIFITKQLTGNIKESVIPYVMASMKQIKIIDKANKEAERAEPTSEMKENVDRLQRYAQNYLRLTGEAIGEPDLQDASQSSVDQPEVESLMPKYPDTFGDYMEMIMQFGLMVFFAPAFPLAALFSLVNNLFEIRSDAFKMCLLFQRPFGQRVANIGTWQNILEVFSTLGIMVNCGLLITYGIIPKLLPNISFYETIIVIILVEHVFLAFNMFLKYSIPDLPRWVIIEKCKLEHRRREALKKLELNEIHNLKNLNDENGTQ